CRRATPTSAAPARSSPQPAHTAGACRTTTSGSTTCARVAPSPPAGRPGRRPERPRNDFGAGLANPSDDGGFEELLDDSFNRASSSAIRASACSNRAASPAFNASNSSYDGGGSAGTTGQRTSLHNRPLPQARDTYPVTS